MVLVGESHLVVAGGDAHAAQGVVDPEEFGRVAVDLDLPLGVPGVAEHEQAVGAGPHRHPHQGVIALTAPEALIAWLAREGLSNPEIGARLFISARTVQYHLGKVFAKLAISSRSQLDRALASDPATTQPLQL